ncbi:hypothetical protein LCGC14_1259130 [marine sediment metagenome]|uniref:Uncharacterized protein n=1 Tax=marine sediment metagenome TaxID=412755 RepID=A0A0F9L3R8_9ZZZZ
MSVEIDAPLVAHDEAIVGDTVYDLRLNHVWRRFVGGILMRAMEYIVFVGTPAEVTQAQEWYSGLVADFYDDTNGGGEMAYLGARVGSTVTVNIPVTYAEQSMLGVIGSGMHDIGGFWDAGASEKLTVPVGGAGYYYCVADAQVSSHSAKAWMNIRKNASVILNDIIVTPNDFRTKSVSSVAFFDDGDFLDFQIRAATTGRTLFVRIAQPYTKQLTMFRVGV